MQIASTPEAAKRRTVSDCLQERVDISSLVFFRVAFGAIMLWEVVRYYGSGWVRAYWVEPTFNFTYPLFGWVHPWPGLGMYYHFIFMGVMAFCVMIGLMFRMSAALLWLGITYVFLLDEGKYLNHVYLVCLISFLMVLLPANRAFAVDSRFEPKLRSSTVPAWAVWLLRFQVGIPYFYGGIAKLNHDWLNGSPMRYWLASRDDFPVVGHLFHHPFAAYFFSYSGLLIDLVAVPLLIWHKSRIWMFIVLVAFHLTNTRLFNIGIFPWTMLAATTIYFSPDWPRRLVADLGRVSWRSVAMMAGAGLGAATALAFRGQMQFIPGVVGAVSGAVIAWGLFPAMHVDKDPKSEDSTVMQPNGRRRLLMLFLAGWAAIQLLVPLRHYLIPGVVHWTEEGHRFAWHMKLRGKEGEINFLARNPLTGEEREIDPAGELAQFQLEKMATRPYMVWLYAQHIARTLRAQGWADVKVFAKSLVRLNGRPPMPMIDESTNLASVHVSLMRHNPWITHLTTPLPPR